MTIYAWASSLRFSRRPARSEWVTALTRRTNYLCGIATLCGAIGLLFSSVGHGAEPESQSDWHYGGYVDVSYAVDFNFPENHRWRSKGTTPRVNEFAPNMLLAYVQKDRTVSSRWGMELGIQGGYDTNALVPDPIPGRDRPADGADTLRHFSRANVSYLAPVGNGLVLTAGLFNSYIGYQSIFAKQNLNYTRSYMADNAPYYMFGVAAEYAVTQRLQTNVYIINGYSYLSHPNNQFSYGTQVSYKADNGVTFTENLYYGPDQFNTSQRFWRFFSDSIIEWKQDRLTLAFAYDIGTEEAAEQAGHPRTFWTAAALYAHWKVSGPWSVAVRPEVYWDRNGRISGSEQVLRAVTTTLEYRIRAAPQSLVARLEYRYDESTGAGGGFFRRGEIAPGIIGLAKEQQLILCSLIWAFDR
ncbi:MAG: outer membrane beta-barrel protein [Nitrospira sp.]|nr:porin [Nitrospira sp.]